MAFDAPTQLLTSTSEGVEVFDATFRDSPQVVANPKTILGAKLVGPDGEVSLYGLDDLKAVIAGLQRVVDRAEARRAA